MATTLTEGNKIGSAFKHDSMDKTVTLYWAKMHPDDIAGKLILHVDYDAAVYLKEDGHSYLLIADGIIKEQCESTVLGIDRIKNELDEIIRNYKPKIKPGSRILRQKLSLLLRE